MIIDLDLKGKQVVVIGAGKEARRKVDSLFTQDCEIIVVAERIGEEISKWSDAGKLTLKQMKVSDGKFLNDYDRLILVMAATDDTPLNRRIVDAAKKLRCYVYSVDDPEYSDFSHPAVLNLHDTVQVAVSTGGKSPLMAGRIRQKTEAVLKEVIGKDDILKIHLQERLRPQAKQHLSSPEKRKQFLEMILDHAEINGLLAEDHLDAAEALARKILGRDF